MFWMPGHMMTLSAGLHGFTIECRCSVFSSGNGGIAHISGLLFGHRKGSGEADGGERLLRGDEMKKLAEDIKIFFQYKYYLAGLALIAAGAYGFAVTHYAVGMDDTAVALYYEDGLAPYVGRFSLFLLNRVFCLSVGEHGIEGFRCERDLERIDQAERIRLEKNMPGYPREGYILEREDYIIVNLEN